MVIPFTHLYHNLKRSSDTLLLISDITYFDIGARSGGIPEQGASMYIARLRRILQVERDR